MTTQISTIKKVLRGIIVVVIGLILVTPWLMGDTMYFPYISLKGLYIRSIIQIALALYVVLMIVDPASRPKRSPLLYAIITFVIVAGISVYTSMSPVRSFWSNYERMEGYILVLHLAVLFIIASAVMRRRDWAWIAGFSLLMSVIVGAHALGDINTAAAQANLQGVAGAELEKVKAAVRISGKLGNSSYLGVYALIHVFIAALGTLMVFRGNREEELQNGNVHTKAQRWSATSLFMIIVGILLTAFNLFILFKTGTRGAFVGLVVGLCVMAGYLMFKEKHKIIKYCSLGIFTAVVLGVVLLGVFKNSTWVQSSPQLSRYAALISFDVKTVTKKLGEDRTMIWGMTLKGVQDKPLFGWGQDNYGYVFAKYYDPGMHAREHWFDRSHNVFLDWMIATGIVGFLSYLAFFVIAAWLLFSKKTRLTVIERATMLGLLAAYFVHNLFVFDNLSSYVLFFLILAYIHDRYTHDRQTVIPRANKDYGTMILGAAFVMVLFTSYTLYKTVYIPYTQNTNLIMAMSIAGQQSKVTKEMSGKIKKMPMDIAYEYFKKIYDAGVPTSETFEQLSAIASAALVSPTVSESTKIKFYQLYQEQIAYVTKNHQGDPRYPFFISNFYRQIGNTEKELEYAKAAYELSPDKQSFAYMVALAEISAHRNTSAALQYVKKAYEVRPDNEEALRYYVYISLEHARKADKTVDLKQVSALAQILADAFHVYGHTIAFDSQLWSVFKEMGNGGAAKKLLAAKLKDLIPEKKEIITDLAK